MSQFTTQDKETIGKAAAKFLWELCCDGQTKPDGLNCAICGDTGHQAFECRFNGFLNYIKERKL